MLREELSILVSTELSDPRLEDALITVTDVQVSADLRSARVFVAHALPTSAARQVLAALRHAESFLRQALLENLNLRFVPELHFQIDTTEERAHRIDALLDAITKQTAPQSVEDVSGDSQ